MAGAELAPVVFGLLSAVTWGAGDFSGGLATRRANVYSVVIWSQLVGLFLLTGLALAFGETPPPPQDWLWCGMAGMAGAVGLMGLYRALALGRMGVAAPLSGVVSAALPVVVGLFLEGLPGGLQLIGFGLALVGVWFLSRSGEASIRASDLGLPFMAGVGFGLFYVFIDRVSATAVFWPLAAARTASLILVLAVVRFSRQPAAPQIQYLPLIALAGALDAGGNAFFVLAAQAGRLDVASVLSSLYPASTVWLAWAFLKERITRPQTLGIFMALGAIVLIAA